MVVVEDVEGRNLVSTYLFAAAIPTYEYIIPHQGPQRGRTHQSVSYLSYYYAVSDFAAKLEHHLRRSNMSTVATKAHPMKFDKPPMKFEGIYERRKNLAWFADNPHLPWPCIGNF